MDTYDKDTVERALTPTDRRSIFERLGFDLDGERPSNDGWISGVLGPSELGEGRNGNFAVNLRTGAVKDHGSSGYSGSLYDAVQDARHLSFPEAVEWVASAAGLSSKATGGQAPSGDGQASSPPSPPHSGDEASGGSPEAVASLEQIQGWHNRLTGDMKAARAARSYLLDERGLSEDVVRASRIGLARSQRHYRDTTVRWWIMIPVVRRPTREKGQPSVNAVKGFGFNPESVDWKRKPDGNKIPRAKGSALYDLVPSDPLDSPVVICEGELDALCALSHHLNAVTGTAGASTFKPEWADYVSRLAPARNRGVIVAYDEDDAGQEGAQTAAEKLDEAGLSVRIASLPHGQDVSDVLIDGGREALESHLAEAEAYEPAPTEPTLGDGQEEDAPSAHSYEPFPIETLPAPVEAYVRAASKALPAEPAMVGVPSLAVLAGAVGNSAQIKLKRSWKEPATLWTVLVAPSGSTKSPAFHHAVRPIFRRETEARDRYEEEYARWKESEEDGQEPTRQRYRTGDATPEAVVQILGDNPRGVLLARDELGAWLGSFDRYVSGAADLQFWIEVWGGVQASRDRVGEGNTTIDQPAVPVTGTIQPGTLTEKLGEIHFDTGFASRLILCKPPTKLKRWTEADVSREVRDGYERMLDRLYSTEPETTLSLSREAKERWVEYYNRANASMEARPEGPAKSVAAKGITHTARLALILHLSRKASGETSADRVDADSIEAAITLGTWLTSETLRVYDELGLDSEAIPPIQRFLARLPDKFHTSKAKDVAQAQEVAERTCEDWLKKLVEAGDLERVRRGLYQKSR